MTRKNVSKISQSAISNWLLFVFFSMLVFFDCCLAHYFAHHSILVSSLWKQPLTFFAFYLPKISISVLCGSFVFLYKKPWGLILFSLLINLWLWANVVYFRVYECAIDGYVLMMAGNLRGFTGSIQSLIELRDAFLFFPTIVLAIYLSLFRGNKTRIVSTFAIMLLVSYILLAASVNLNYVMGQYKNKSDVVQKVLPIECLLNPFSQKARAYTFATAPYYDYSLLHMAGFALDDVISIYRSESYSPEFTNAEIDALNKLQGAQYYKHDIQGNVVIVLFESLEDWVVRPEFMPNTFRLINTNHALVAHKIQRQTKYGGSADGQMIINTGLLPISSDAACFRYPFNTYPSLPKFHAATLLPHPIDVWNQRCMSPAYGYDTTIVMTEQAAFDATASLMTSGYDFIQIITMASHEPFNRGLSDIVLPPDMPDMMAAYIRSVNCTDSYIGQMLDSMEIAGLLPNTTIVITGDHTIFHKERRDVFAAYCISKDYQWGVEGAYCPLIIYSPNLIEFHEDYSDAYQMDVYPTILGVLGYDDYYWKGFGANLLNLNSADNRILSIKEADMLSDKIIRSNYFEKRK